MSNPHRVTVSVTHNGKSTRTLLVLIGYKVAHDGRFEDRDRIDFQFDLRNGVVRIVRNKDGRWTLNRRKPGKSRPVAAAQPLVVSIKLRPGFPYARFTDRLPSAVAEHMFDDDGALLIYLPKHPQMTSAKDF